MRLNSLVLRAALHEHIARERSKLTPAFRRRVFAEFGPVCFYCDDDLTPDTQTIDHLTPLVHGGRTEEDNCVPACLGCNIAKGDRSRHEFLAPTGFAETRHIYVRQVAAVWAQMVVDYALRGQPA